MIPGYWMHETSGVLRPAVHLVMAEAEQIATGLIHGELDGSDRRRPH